MESSSVLKVVGQVAGIGGLALGVLLLIFRDVIRKNIFPSLDKIQAYRILRLIIVSTFLIAALGIGAWVYVQTIKKLGDIDINAAKAALNIPSFDNSLEPDVSGRSVETPSKFNTFMIENEDRVVYLSVYLAEDMVREFQQGQNTGDQIVFTVSNTYGEFGSGGNEYLIHLAEGTWRDFAFDKKTRRLSGYFKIWGVNGPRQGYMSVNLRPVKVD